MSASVCGSKDGAAFANGCPVVCVYEGDGPQILCCITALNDPAASAIGAPDNCSMVANDGAGIRVHKGSAAK
jgi:hypothetical protein